MSGLSNPAGWLLDWFRGGESKGSVAVNNKSMLGSAAIWYAITTIAGDVAKMPLEPRKTKANGLGSDVMIANPAWRLLRDEPNGYQTADVFKEQIQGHALGWGNGRAAVIWERGRVSELIPLMPDRTVTCMVQGEKYHVTCPLEDDPLRFESIVAEVIEGQVIPRDCIVLPDNLVLHILGFGSNGFDGLNIADVARDSFGSDLQAQRYSKRGMEKGFAGKMILSAPPGSFRNEDDAKKFLDGFNERHQNDKQGETVSLLREGITATVLNMNNVDAQFIETRKFNRQDVMLWFGLQHIPGDDSSVSYNSLEQKMLAYLASCLDRWLVRWEMQCDAKLRTKAEKEAGQVYFKFNRATWLQTDMVTTANTLNTLVMGRIINRNEARKKLDMNPVPDGDEFENPAIDVNPKQEPAKPAKTAAQSRIDHMVTVEANQVTAGAANKPTNFLTWLDAHYVQWSAKLGKVAEEVGADVDAVLSACESRRMEVVKASECKPDELAACVGKVCEAWKVNGVTKNES